MYTFTCSTGCDLAADTTYFVVMSTADTSGANLYSWRRTTSDDQTITPSTATGWAIADNGLYNWGGGWTNLSREHTTVLSIAANNK